MRGIPSINFALGLLALAHDRVEGQPYGGPGAFRVAPRQLALARPTWYPVSFRYYQLIDAFASYGVVV